MIFSWFSGTDGSRQVWCPSGEDPGSSEGAHWGGRALQEQVAASSPTSPTLCCMQTGAPPTWTRAVSCVLSPSKSQVSRCNVIKSVRLSLVPRGIKGGGKNRLSVDPVALKGWGFNTHCARSATRQAGRPLAATTQDKRCDTEN